MNPEPVDNENFDREIQMGSRAGIKIELFTFQNIFYVGNQIGKGFREGYARVLLDNMVDGVIIFDELGKIQVFNPVAEEVFSYTADEAQMEPVDKLIPKLRPESYTQFMKNGRENDESQEIGKKMTGIRKNGFAISLNLLIKKIDFNGCFLYMVIIRKE